MGAWEAEGAVHRASLGSRTVGCPPPLGPGADVAWVATLGSSGTKTLKPPRGRVQSGNSGGSLLDASGRVQATVFATTVGGASAGGYGVPDVRVRAAPQGASGPVSTGPCAR